MKKDPALYPRLRDTGRVGPRRGGSRRRWIAYDIAFHRALVEASGLRPLASICDLLQAFFHKFRDVHDDVRRGKEVALPDSSRPFIAGTWTRPSGLLRYHMSSLTRGATTTACANSADELEDGRAEAVMKRVVTFGELLLSLSDEGPASDWCRPRSSPSATPAPRRTSRCRWPISGSRRLRSRKCPPTRSARRASTRCGGTASTPTTSSAAATGWDCSTWRPARRSARPR